MGMRVMVGHPLSVLFVPRGSTLGAPVELEDVSAELVRASDFEVVGRLGEGLTLTHSGLPHGDPDPILLFSFCRQAECVPPAIHPQFQKVVTFRISTINAKIV